MLRGWQKCLELDVESEKGHYRLACALVGAERWGEAIPEFEEGESGKHCRAGVCVHRKMPRVLSRVSLRDPCSPLHLACD